MRKHERNFPSRVAGRYGYGGGRTTSKDETPFMSLNAEDVPLFYNPLGRIKVDEEHLVCLKGGGRSRFKIFLNQ